MFSAFWFVFGLFFVCFFSMRRIYSCCYILLFNVFPSFFPSLSHWFSMFVPSSFFPPVYEVFPFSFFFFHIFIVMISRSFVQKQPRPVESCVVFVWRLGCHMISVPATATLSNHVPVFESIVIFFSRHVTPGLI